MSGDDSSSIESADVTEADEIPEGPPPAPTLPPSIAYQEALGKYPHSVAIGIATALGLNDIRKRKSGLAEVIGEALGTTKVAERLINGLDHSSRLALGIFALGESYACSTQGLRLSLECLDVDFADAVVPLINLGLLAFETAADTDLASWNPGVRVDAWPRSTLRLFPGAMSSIRTTLPIGEGPKSVDTVRLVRESDGLEPILRLAVLWQRVSEAPLRQTQSGPLYKRDRDRIEEDQALVGPIADAIEPLPDPAAFWLALGRGVGLIEAEPGTERIVAAPASFWEDNAFHLPQMVASRWFTLTRWHEQGGAQAHEVSVELTLPCLRVACLLWLAKLESDQWCAVESLAALFDSYSTRWHLPLLGSPIEAREAGGLGFHPC